MNRGFHWLAIVTGVAIAGSALADGKPPEWWARPLEAPRPVTNAGDASVLFVLNSQNAQMSGGELTVRGLDQGVIWYTDRPERLVGRIDTRQLVSAWTEGEDSFAADPPNAVISGIADGKVTDLTVTLESLREEGERIVFRVAPLEGQSLPTSLVLSDVNIVVDSDTTYIGRFIDHDNFGAMGEKNSEASTSSNNIIIENRVIRNSGDMGIGGGNDPDAGREPGSVFGNDPGETFGPGEGAHSPGEGGGRR